MASICRCDIQEELNRLVDDLLALEPDEEVGRVHKNWTAEKIDLEMSSYSNIKY